MRDITKTPQSKPFWGRVLDRIMEFFDTTVNINPTKVTTKKIRANALLYGAVSKSFYDDFYSKKDKTPENSIEFASSYKDFSEEYSKIDMGYAYIDYDKECYKGEKVSIEISLKGKCSELEVAFGQFNNKTPFKAKFDLSLFFAKVTVESGVANFGEGEHQVRPGNDFTQTIYWELKGTVREVETLCCLVELFNADTEAELIKNMQLGIHCFDDKKDLKTKTKIKRPWKEFYAYPIVQSIVVVTTIYTLIEKIF